MSGGLLAFLGVLAYLGTNFDVQHEVEVEATLPYSQELIFDMIASVGNIPDWNKDITAVEITSKAPLEWAETYSTGQVMNYRILEMKKPELLVRKIIDEESPFQGQWTFRFEAVAPEQTKLTIREIGQIDNPLIRYLAHEVMGVDSFLKDYVESIKTFAPTYQAQYFKAASGSKSDSSTTN